MVELLIMTTEQKRQKLDKSVLPILPQEVWCMIFAYLSKESRKSAKCTCKLWFEIIRRDSRFSGNIKIPWIELQNSSFDWDNWPSLKTIDITSDPTSFPSPKIALEALKALGLKKCKSLITVTFLMDYVSLSLSVGPPFIERHSFDDRIQVLFETG